MSVTPRDRTVELPPLPGQPDLLLRSFAYWLTQYRRTWRGTAISTVLEPLGFLAALGLGLGVLVDEGSGSATLEGVGYLEFLAPGLLAATAMQTTAFESTYPVMGAIKWLRTYHAMLATPLRVVDVLGGHLLFVAFRLVMTSTVFLLVMAVFGAIASPWGLLALPVAVLTGLAFAPAIFAFSATRENDSGFAMLFRFGIMPMFLFSGTFFAVSLLPAPLEVAAWFTPLFHGVSLCRGISLGGTPLWRQVVHTTFLVALAIAGTMVGRRTLARRLYA
jgi:lipooligosaccharide transport system permease protein